MDKKVHYKMSQKQLSRYVVVLRLIERKITIKEAAISLGLSERQILRLKKGVQVYGVSALQHKNSGRCPHHALDGNLKERILTLKRSHPYSQANFCHFQELLAEYEGIKISYAALYDLLTRNGIMSPKKRRRFKVHRRRKRKDAAGVLVQLDASPFDWLGDGRVCHLHGAIDDASGQAVGLYLAERECMRGYFETMHLMLELFGIPISIYSDRHTIFFSPEKGRLSIEDQLAGKKINLTQFGRTMGQLGITMIPAYSPQAKGRIERLWQTLQSRLPVEFERAGIKCLEEANPFLREYIPKFNQRFEVETEKESLFRPIPEGLLIENILCIIQRRTYDRGGAFSFGGKHFKIMENKGLPLLPPKGRIEVLVNPRFGLKVSYQGNIYEIVPYDLPRAIRAVRPVKEKQVWIPDNLHYYKHGKRLIDKVSYVESDREILEMLENLSLGRITK